MKILHEEADVRSSGKEQSSFRIQANGHAFRILSDGLYQHKVAAIVRELCCNAYDSHVAAGKSDTPFRVKMSTIFEHVFEVEDYGVGLSDTDVREIYSTYFYSTKQDSNEMIGALGLGSKTPFSYTDSFRITSRYNGVECRYIARMNEVGEPVIEMLSQKPTSECNGVKVSIDVNPDDWITFLEEAKFILSFFPQRPLIEGHEVEYAYPESVVETLNTKGYVQAEMAGNSNMYTHNLYIVMGNVCYPVNAEKALSDSPYVNFFTMSSTDVWFVKMPIGDANVSASRESLSLDERTLANVRNRLEDIAVKNLKAYQDILDSHTSFFVALSKIGLTQYDKYWNMLTFGGKPCGRWGHWNKSTWFNKRVITCYTKVPYKKLPHRLEFSIRQLFGDNNNVEVLLTDGAKSHRGIHAMAKAMTGNNMLVLVMDMKRRHFERYASIFGLKWKVYTLAELKAEGKVQTAVSSYKSKRTATEVRCNCLEIKDGKMNHRVQTVVDLADAEFENYQTIERITSKEIFGVSMRYHMASEVYKRSFLSNIDRPVRIIQAHDNLQKKLDANNVARFSKLVDEFSPGDSGTTFYRVNERLISVNRLQEDNLAYMPDIFATVFKLCKQQGVSRDMVFHFERKAKDDEHEKVVNDFIETMKDDYPMLYSCYMGWGGFNREQIDTHIMQVYHWKQLQAEDQAVERLVA